MKKQITNISIHQSGKVIAIMYFVFAAVFCIPSGLYIFFSTGAAESLLLILAPFLYALFGYITFAIFAFVYNLVASSFGGIEFSVSENDE